MSKINHLTTGIVLVLCGLVSACVVPQTTANLDHAASAIRAARVAGADTYATAEIESADKNFQKAQALIRNNRANRAQKLLELATAQADLAAAISEAEHAEDAITAVNSDQY